MFAVAARMNMPLMYQQAGGNINQAFLAHEVAVFKMATIDHVNVSHLWKEDVTVEEMPVVGGSVQVPEGPGLGITLDRRKLEKCAAQSPHDRGRYLIRVRFADGLTICKREAGAVRAPMRSFEKLHGGDGPSLVPTYDAKVCGDFWEESEEPAAFERWWTAAEAGPVWEPSWP